jgi:hypothetical protein
MDATQPPPCFAYYAAHATTLPPTERIYKIKYTVLCLLGFDTMQCDSDLHALFENCVASTLKVKIKEAHSCNTSANFYQASFMYEKPTNALAILYILYYSHLCVSAAFCDHPQGVQYTVQSTTKSCVQ